MKPFKTHNQQLAILRSRGMLINNGSKAKRILENEGYYNVINGYKDLFLTKDSTGDIVVPEQYKSNTRFEEVHSLYLFDRELRNILLKYLLVFEKSIKSKLSYRFSEKFKLANAYLDLRSYTNNPKQLKQVLGLITIISSTISKHADKKSGSIKHYLDNHQEVPLWVLSNQLTIGNIQNFYMCLDDSLKDQIAKDFSERFKKQYKLTIPVTKEALVEILKTANHFRNVCAHEERLFCFKLSKPSKSSYISNLVNIPSLLLKEGNLFTIIVQLKIVLTKKDFYELLRNLKQLFSKYESQFETITFDEILDSTGFPNNWETFFF